ISRLRWRSRADPVWSLRAIRRPGTFGVLQLRGLLAKPVRFRVQSLPASGIERQARLLSDKPALIANRVHAFRILRHRGRLGLESQLDLLGAFLSRPGLVAGSLPGEGADAGKALVALGAVIVQRLLPGVLQLALVEEEIDSGVSNSRIRRPLRGLAVQER